MKRFALVMSVLLLTACGTETTNQNEQTVKPNTEQSPEPVVEMIEATADELLNSYKENELAGDEKYKGKTLIITGKINSIQSGLGDTPFILLNAGGDMEFALPQAHFSNSEKQSLLELKKGTNVKLQCIGDGEIGGTPMLKDCKVL